MDRLTRIKKIPKIQKKSFIYKTVFSFKDLTQSSECPLIQLATLNDLVGTTDLFTKCSIHWNLFKPTFEVEIRKLKTQVSATFQLHFIFGDKKILNNLNFFVRKKLILTGFYTAIKYCFSISVEGLCSIMCLTNENRILKN